MVKASLNTKYAYDEDVVVVVVVLLVVLLTEDFAGFIIQQPGIPQPSKLLVADFFALLPPFL